ncbi:thioesterase II family protein [Actinokineospora sp.]|uniref:thioesterase II family protein n=1 Tax=Actinokineospora sp. TaxID=1872133 RepID=UPI004037C393
MSPPPSSAVVRPQPVPDARLRLFLFHHAGGSHHLFRDWLPLLPADWDAVLVDAPGRGRDAGTPAMSDVDSAVDWLLTGLRPWLDLPFVFFGHSMGALLAQELTLRLAADDLPLPTWVGLSGRGAPRADGGLDTPARHTLPSPKLREAVARIGGSPREILDDPEWWALLEPMLRADFRLVETWRPVAGRPRLPVPVSAFGGTRDPAVPPERLTAWAEHTDRFLGVHLFPGDHFYFRQRLADVVGQIRADVATAGAAPRLRAAG